MKRITLHGLVVIAFAFSLAVSSCSKKTMDQPPSTALNTTTANIKAGATGVLLADATTMAQQFLQSKNPNSTVSIKSAETVTKNGVPYMHIINANNNLGFAILSADSMYAPLLAYDSIGNFDKDNLNPGLAMWFNKHAHELEFVRSTKSIFVDSIATINKAKWKAMAYLYKKQQARASGISINSAPITGTPELIGYNVQTNIVGPLLHSHWSQQDPFNHYCPAGSYSLGHVPAGCVPVAMGQIMGFWKWPKVNFGISYNWDIMPIKEPLGTSVDPGYFEAAKLLFYIGSGPSSPGYLAQFVSYSDPKNGDEGSSADVLYCSSVFNRFQYSATDSKSLASQVAGGAQNGASYAGLLANEISVNQRPCLVSGNTSKGTVAGLVYWPRGASHAWVCDGNQQTMVQPIYSTPSYDIDGNLVNTVISLDAYYSVSNLLHMNWGWGTAPSLMGGANNDGWYNASIDYTASPDHDGDDFSYFQRIVYNIHP